MEIKKKRSQALLRRSGRIEPRGDYFLGGRGSLRSGVGVQITELPKPSFFSCEAIPFFLSMPAELLRQTNFLIH